MQYYKPMLASKVELKDIKYPCLVSSKLDGIRAMKYDGVLYSRNGKPIKNKQVQNLFRYLPDGVDGELVYGNSHAPDVFRKTTHIVMSEDVSPTVTVTGLMYHIFDNFLVENKFTERYKSILAIPLEPYTHSVVSQVPVNNEEELLKLEKYYVGKLGYEGLIIRSSDSPYKHGRSSVKEGYLLKLKRFEDSEAEILGIEALQHNTNEQTKDTLGKSTRSSHKAGKVALEKVGSLHVRDIHTGVTFNIGSGLNDELRCELWENNPIGKIIKYKYFPVGVKDAPRFPTFLGLRDRSDMD